MSFRSFARRLSQQLNSLIGRTPLHPCRVSTAGAVALLGLAVTADGKVPVPWQIGHDLRSLAVIHPGDQVLLRSSHCLDGCRYDRHSDGDWRYIRVEGDEGVIFEELGAGAITRIWVTQGYGTSTPLSPSIRVRVYVDGASSPVVDLPLPALFDGSTAPFTAPLVGNRLVSSGGNFSYVPMAYRNGCKITLTGAHEEMIWFQVNFHRMPTAQGVTSFTGGETFDDLSALLACRGDDPWLLGAGLPASSSLVDGEVLLTPGQSVRLTELSGPDLLTAIRLKLPHTAWSQLLVSLRFDGQVRASMSAAEFFAVGRGGPASTRSLLTGVDANETLYSYFPMPFFVSASIDLRLSHEAAAPVPVGWSVRRWGAPPLPGSGLFTAQLQVDDETPSGVDIPLLQHNGQGRWVGLFAELGSVGTSSREYLEGDERVFVDASAHPAVYGTGTEDIFNGGFYFDQGPFQLSLHGAPYHLIENGEDTTAMYRLMLNDGITWALSVNAGLEAGPTGSTPVRARTVAFAYQLDEPALWRWDRIELGSATSREAHEYQTEAAFELRPLDSSFEGEPPQTLAAKGIYRSSGSAAFNLHYPADAGLLRIRRRFDAALPWQKAELRVDHTAVAAIPPAPINLARRWQEIDVNIAPPAAAATGRSPLLVEIDASLPPGAVPNALSFSEFTWELWADRNPLIFGDGFESGSTAAWSDNPPPPYATPGTPEPEAAPRSARSRLQPRPELAFSPQLPGLAPHVAPGSSGDVASPPGSSSLRGPR